MATSYFSSSSNFFVGKFLVTLGYISLLVDPAWLVDSIEFDPRTEEGMGWITAWNPCWTYWGSGLRLTMAAAWYIVVAIANMTELTSVA